jgi:hypothetical protein
LHWFYYYYYYYYYYYSVEEGSTGLLYERKVKSVTDCFHCVGMASLPQHEVSFASGTSTRSYKPNTTRIQPYVSPFVAEAKRRAELRVRERIRKYSSSGRRPSSPAVSSQDRGEWNQSVQAPTLFDPQLRKQEIFRLGPKTAARNESQQSEHDRNDRTRNEKIIRSSSAPRMTVRASSSIPTRGGMQNRSHSRVDDQNVDPEYTEHPTSTFLPKSSTEVSRPRVTRSTSPIDDRAMNNILGVERDHPEASQFTLRNRVDDQHRTPGQAAATFQQFLRDHGRARDSADPQSIREHYGNMIKDRLRQLLQQHREEKDTDTNDTAPAEPAAKSYPYFSRLRRQGSGSGVLGGYFRPGDVNDTQLMTRDLMASMAQIMTAVGEIVTNQQLSQHRNRSRKKWYKDHPTDMSSNGKSQSETKSASASSPSVISSARVKTPAKAPMLMSELAALSAAKGIAGIREKEKSQALKQDKDVTKKEFMWDMAQALRPEVLLQEAATTAPFLDPNAISLPKNKAAVFDMIFSKLQSIEKCERDLIDYLQEPRDNPTTSTTDPIVNQLKKRKSHLAGQGSEMKMSQIVPQSRNPDQRIPSAPISSAARSEVVEEAIAAGNSTYDFLKRYPPLGTISSCLRSDFEEYKEKLDRARKNREIVFLKKNSDLSTVADTVADALCDRIIGSVAAEIGGFVEDYSKNYVKKL